MLRVLHCADSASCKQTIHDNEGRTFLKSGLYWCGVAMGGMVGMALSLKQRTDTKTNILKMGVSCFFFLKLVLYQLCVTDST